MANPKRDLPKRKLAQSIKHLDESLANIQQMHLLFDDGKHKPFTDLLAQIAIGHKVIEDMILTFWKHAYGKVPDNIHTYRG